ncbi:MAG: hypothetical protein AABX13_02680 [Nanoarchaeota archaeon]
MKAAAIRIIIAGLTVFLMLGILIVVGQPPAPTAPESSQYEYASESGYSTEFQQDLQTIGIDPGFVSNCDLCSYDTSTGTLTLAVGASVRLEGAAIKEGTIIELNGGELHLSGGGTVSGEGSYTAGEPPLLQGGVLTFNPEQKTTTIIFQDAMLLPEDGGEIKGTGKVVNGIIFIDQADLSYNGIVDKVAKVQVEKFSQNKVHLLAGQNFRLGDDRHNVRLGGLGDEELQEITLSKGKSGETVLTIGQLIDDPDLPWQREVGKAPIIKVQGKPTFSVGDSPHFTLDPPQPLILDYRGEEHRFLGNLQVNEGKLSFPKNLDLRQPQMIDGIYLRPRTDVAVYFDDNAHAGENYVALGEKLRMGGDNFVAALGEQGKGCPHILFCYAFEGNKYSLKEKEEGSPFRLLFNFDSARRQKATAEPLSEAVPGGGEVIIDPDTKQVHLEGTLRLINGVHELDYFQEEGEQKFNYQPAACGRGGRDWFERSCTRLDYDFIDGGRVNVVQKTNMVTARQGEDIVTLPNFRPGSQGKGREVKALLEKEEVYVLGYKGGEFPETLLGKGKGELGWGHVGLLYCAPTSAGCEWTVTEADGRTVVRGPLDNSLFSSKAHGIWKVVDDQKRPLTVDKVIPYTETIIGAPYGKLSLTGSSFSCVKVVCESLKAGGVALQKPAAVTFGNLPAGELSAEAIIYTVALEALPSAALPHIPDTVVQSPNLQPVPLQIPVEPVNQELVNEEIADTNVGG